MDDLGWACWAVPKSQICSLKKDWWGTGEKVSSSLMPHLWCLGSILPQFHRLWSYWESNDLLNFLNQWRIFTSSLLKCISTLVLMWPLSSWNIFSIGFQEFFMSLFFIFFISSHLFHSSHPLNSSASQSSIHRTFLILSCLPKQCVHLMVSVASSTVWSRELESMR